MMTMNSSSSVNYSQYHESRIRGENVSNLTRGCIISRLKVMLSQEQSTYSYRSYEPPMFPPDPSSRYNVDESIPHLNSSWREKICHWSFSVIVNLPNSCSLSSSTVYSSQFPKKGFKISNCFPIHWGMFFMSEFFFDSFRFNYFP